MAGDGSAYDALGLEPGADPVSIERAYKRLIKLYHPDMEGGDPQRAAEINRAYSELRAKLGPRDTLLLATHDEPVAEARRGRWWIRAAVAVLVVLGGLLAVTGPVGAYIRQLMPDSVPQDALGNAAPAARAGDTMDQPIHVAALSAAVRQAVAMLGAHNDRGVIGASRDCHRALHLEPSVTQLDRCAAFDDAIVQLENRDPMWDQGPFSQLAVTGRQWSAASALSSDYLAIDSRLDRIRVQVELALAPPVSMQPVQPVPSLSVAPSGQLPVSVDSNVEDLNEALSD